MLASKYQYYWHCWSPNVRREDCRSWTPSRASSPRPIGGSGGLAPASSRAHCCVVADAAHPDVWDANHADNVTAKTEAEIQAVFAAMDRRLGHTPWRVVHSDCLTSDKFLARLALDDVEERFVAIQMALEGDVADRGRRWNCGR